MVGSLRWWIPEVEAKALFLIGCMFDDVCAREIVDSRVVYSIACLLGSNHREQGLAQCAALGEQGLVTESPGRGPVPGELGSPGRPGSCYGTPAGASPSGCACAVRAGAGRDLAPKTPGWNPVLGELGSPRRPGSCYGTPAGASPEASASLEPMRFVGAITRYSGAPAGANQQRAPLHAHSGSYWQQALPPRPKGVWSKYGARSGNAAQLIPAHLAAPPGRAEREGCGGQGWRRSGGGINFDELQQEANLADAQNVGEKLQILDCPPTGPAVLGEARPGEMLASELLWRSRHRWSTRPQKG